MKRLSSIACGWLLAMGLAAAQTPQPVPGMPGMPQIQPGQNPMQQSPQADPVAVTVQKRPGTILIGIAPPVAQIVQGNEGLDASEAIRTSIIQYIRGPLVDVTTLSSRIDIQLLAEAKQKECDYIFQSTVVQKKGGGMLGRLGSAGKMASGVIPMGGIPGSMGSVATGIAVNAATTAANVAVLFKNKDEITFQFKVTSSEGTALAANSTKKKASQDGDDVLTPQIEQAATTTLEALSKKK